MVSLAAIIERDLSTGLLIASVPGVPSAHTQGETVEEVRANLQAVLGLLIANGAVRVESEFVAMTLVSVPAPPRRRWKLSRQPR